MPDTSVWNEQIDTALLQFIPTFMKLPTNGEDQPIPVTFRKPENDFQVEVFPSITVSFLYSLPDTVRYFPDQVKVSQTGNTCVMEEHARPYILVYQIDFWSKFIEQRNLMLKMWGAKIWRDFNLDVLDAAGNVRSSFVQERDVMRSADFVSKNERIFHSYITYGAYAEIDMGIQQTIPMVTEVDVRLSRKE